MIADLGAFKSLSRDCVQQQLHDTPAPKTTAEGTQDKPAAYRILGHRTVDAEDVIGCPQGVVGTVKQYLVVQKTASWRLAS
eukprot:SAG31_NODE_43209_length_268_cov_0.609467_1_plen_80_part_10